MKTLFLFFAAVGSPCVQLLVAQTPAARPCSPVQIQRPPVSIEVRCDAKSLWELQIADAGAYRFAPAVIPFASGPVSTAISDLHQSTDEENGEFVVSGRLQGSPDLTLRIVFRLTPGSPIVRFRYQLEASNPQAHLAFGNGPLEYFSLSAADFTRGREVQLANFQGLTHSYNLSETDLSAEELAARSSILGPILALSDNQHSLVLAYEHGSTVPDAYLRYTVRDQRVHLFASKGNVYPGQLVDSAHPWQSVWFEAGAVAGPIDALAPVFRRFVLNGMAPHSDTRKALVFYNTWNYQERQKWSAHRDYLESINLDRALKEIEVAHQIGIDVYVLDTGWYRTTGDWQVSPERFPDGLQQIRRKLDSYGMRLGLWFGPTSAAVSSHVVHDHPEWRASWNGKVGNPSPVWGTEPSYQMCMVSGYSHAFAQKVIEVARATGATYFKWDAVGQHACNDPHHDHGIEANTPEERDASYSFQMIGRMTQAAAEISDAIPGAIVDMDVTESGRAFGLGFLASGKFFLVNNGPYLFDYDLPMDKEKDNWNLFFYPGPARTWIARTPLALDKWIPSTLLLTHYFPDDPANLQELNIASMILGQDGIWGDLTAVSPEGVRTMARLISRYKQVGDDMASADPVVTGLLNGSPEIHEKIAANGRGAVVLFATVPGSYEYTTHHAVSSEHWSSNPVTVRALGDGRAHITAEFAEPGARIVYFGIAE